MLIAADGSVSFEYAYRPGLGLEPRLSHADASERTRAQADVLVCSRGGGGMLAERMQLLSLLWSAGVSAETMHVTSPSAAAQYECVASNLYH